MKFGYLFFTLLWCCFTANLQAARLERPYGVDVPVASQSVDERNKASVLGLQQLLLKLTGRPANENAVVKERLQAGVDKFILQYSYEKGVDVDGYLPASTFVLRLSFSQTAVLQLLHDAAIPLWPLDRPQLLVLMLDAQDAWMPGLDPVMTAQLWQLGLAYGVPVKSPLRDVQDLTDMTADAVKSADANALQASVIRYQSDALLTGVVTGDAVSGWQGKWTLQFRDAKQVIEKKAANLPDLLAALFLDISFQLSGHYRESASHDAGITTVRLQVDSVTSYGSYTQLREYLEKLDAVKRVSVVQIEGASVLVDVEVTGKESFRSLLALFRPLVAQDAVAPEVMPDTSIATQPAEPVATSTVDLPAVWRYRWVQ